MKGRFLATITLLVLVTVNCSHRGHEPLDSYDDSDSDFDESDTNEDLGEINVEEDGFDRIVECDRWILPDEVLVHGTLLEGFGTGSLLQSFRVVGMGGKFWVHVDRSPSVDSDLLFEVSLDGVVQRTINCDHPSCPPLWVEMQDFGSDVDGLFLLRGCASLLNTDGTEGQCFDADCGEYFIKQSLDRMVLGRTETDGGGIGLRFFPLNDDGSMAGSGFVVELLDGVGNGWRDITIPDEASSAGSDRIVTLFGGWNTVTSDLEVVFMATD